VMGMFIFQPQLGDQCQYSVSFPFFVYHDHSISRYSRVTSARRLASLSSGPAEHGRGRGGRSHKVSLGGTSLYIMYKHPECRFVISKAVLIRPIIKHCAYPPVHTQGDHPRLY
jgi:hypothetical protein